jgi:hypothetical protein
MRREGRSKWRWKKREQIKREGKKSGLSDREPHWDDTAAPVQGRRGTGKRESNSWVADGGPVMVPLFHCLPSR